MKIFVCRRCKVYCNVDAGLVSDCCKDEVYMPQRQTKLGKKIKINPAL